MAAVTDEMVAIRGPLEIIDGKFVLQIPLAEGGDVLAKLAGTMGRIDGDVLRIELPKKLVGELEWKAGDIVSIDNHEGLLNIEVWDGTE